MRHRPTPIIRHGIVLLMVRGGVWWMMVSLDRVVLVHLVAVMLLLLLLLVGVVRGRHGVSRVGLLRVLIEVRRRRLYAHIWTRVQSDRIGRAAFVLVAPGIARLALPARPVLGIVRVVRIAVGPSLLLGQELLLSLSRSSPPDLDIVGTAQRSFGTMPASRSDSVTSVSISERASVTSEPGRSSNRDSLKFPASTKVTRQSRLFRLIAPLPGRN